MGVASDIISHKPSLLFSNFFCCNSKQWKSDNEGVCALSTSYGNNIFPSGT